MAPPQFLAAGSCEVSSGSCGKAALRGELALPQTRHPQRAGAAQGRGAPASPSHGPQQTPWGNSVSNCSATTARCCLSVA